MSEQKRKFSWLCLTGFILPFMPLLVMALSEVCFKIARGKISSFVSFRLLPFSYIFFPLAGIIVSIVGLVTAKKKGKTGRGFAIAGIALPSIVVIVIVSAVLIFLIMRSTSTTIRRSPDLYGMGPVGCRGYSGDQEYSNDNFDVSQLRLPEGYDFSNITVSDTEFTAYADSRLQKITEKSSKSIKGTYQDYVFLIVRSDCLDKWLTENCDGSFEYGEGYASTYYMDEWEIAAYRAVPLDVYKDPSDKFIIITNCGDYKVVSDFFGITDNYIEPTEPTALETVSSEFLENNEQVVYLKNNITEDMTLPEIVDVYEKMCEEYPSNDQLHFITGGILDSHYDSSGEFVVDGDYYYILLQRWISLDEGLFAINVYIIYEANYTTSTTKSENVADYRLDVDFFDYVRDSKAYAYGSTADIVRVDVEMKEL